LIWLSTACTLELAPNYDLSEKSGPFLPNATVSLSLFNMLVGLPFGLLNELRFDNTPIIGSFLGCVGIGYP